MGTIFEWGRYNVSIEVQWEHHPALTLRRIFSCNVQDLDTHVSDLNAH